MANKEKKIIPTNLLKIREELNYSQKELGGYLGVSERMVCNYETGESNLPIDKAIFISEKWNYSLNWIYCNCDFSEIQMNSYKEKPNFLEDIRHFFKLEGNQVVFSVPQYYWDYMFILNKINSSMATDNEKKRKIAELNASYRNANKTGISMEYSIEKDKFVSMICLGDNFHPFASENQPCDNFETSEEKKQEVLSFLKLITSQNDE